MLRKDSYPCDACAASVCDYCRCQDYGHWLQLNWDRFAANTAHNYWENHSTPEEKFLYIHPEVFLRYLESGPCARCVCAARCRTPCAKYWVWWDIRMVWLKRKFQNTFAKTEKENPSRVAGGILYDTNSASLAIKSLFLGQPAESGKYSFQTSSLRCR